MLRSITCLFVLSVFAPAYADDPPATTSEEVAEASADETATAKAGKGTPEIDGKVDKLWLEAPKVAVKKPIAGLLAIDQGDMAIARVRLLWDDDHIYALWQVKDSELSTDGQDDWAQDSVEVFVDADAKRTTSYEADDAQYRVNAEGRVSGQGTGYDEGNVTAATRKTKSGYVVEMAIKIPSRKLKAGDKLGLELQVNDDHGSGGRDAVAKWNHTEDDSWEDTSNFGTLVLE